MAISCAELQNVTAPPSPILPSESNSVISSGSSINPYEGNTRTFFQDQTFFSGSGSVNTPSPSSQGGLSMTPPFPPLAQRPSATVTQPQAALSRKSKRKADTDLSQVATDAARHHKLGKKACKELTMVAKLSLAEQSIWSTALTLSVLSKLEKGAGAGPTEWQIPTELSKFIKKESFVLLLTPTLARYSDKLDDLSKDIPEHGPLTALWAKIKESKNISYQPSMHRVAAKRRIINLFIRKNFNERRHRIKSKIQESLGTKDNNGNVVTPPLNIIQLTQSIISILKSSKVKLNFERVTRVSVLRNAFVLARQRKTDYWCTVDQELYQVRKSNPAIRNQYFRNILDSDTTSYGLPEELKALKKKQNSALNNSEDEGSTGDESDKDSDAESSDNESSSMDEENGNNEDGEDGEGDEDDE